MTIPKELEPLAREARKYKSAEEFAQSVTSKQFREILNQSGYSDYGERSFKGGKFGARSRQYGDHLFAQDREIFNQMFSDFKNGKGINVGDIKTATDFYTQATKGVKSPAEGKIESVKRIPEKLYLKTHILKSQTPLLFSGRGEGAQSVVTPYNVKVGDNIFEIGKLGQIKSRGEVISVKGSIIQFNDRGKIETRNIQFNPLNDEELKNLSASSIASKILRDKEQALLDERESIIYSGKTSRITNEKKRLLEKTFQLLKKVRLAMQKEKEEFIKNYKSQLIEVKTEVKPQPAKNKSNWLPIVLIGGLTFLLIKKAGIKGTTPTVPKIGG